MGKIRKNYVLRLVDSMLRRCAAVVAAKESSNTPSLTEKVLGGLDAFPGEIEYMAYLGHKNDLKCNAFLISKRNALVPAHFLERFWLDYPPPNFFEFYILAVGYEMSPRSERCAIEQVEHIDGYNPDAKKLNLNYDIAVIKLQNEITSEGLSYIDLPIGDEIKLLGRHQHFAVGWDLSPFMNKLILKKAVVIEMRHDSDCGVSSSPFLYCVEAYAHFCPMDLGSPLVLGDKPIGIMTATVDGQPNLAVFTSVIEHREEIGRLKEILRLSTYINAPRTFARYDWRKRFHPIPPYYKGHFKMIGV